TVSGLSRGVRDPGFRVMLQRLEDSPVLEGNRVDVLLDRGRAYAAMAGAVREAEREVLVAFYLARGDASGLAGELAAAARRGVAVRVLADAPRARDEALWAPLRRAAADVHLRPSARLAPWDLGRRARRKLLIVDERVAFTGGAN